MVVITVGGFKRKCKVVYTIAYVIGKPISDNRVSRSVKTGIIKKVKSLSGRLKIGKIAVIITGGIGVIEAAKLLVIGVALAAIAGVICIIRV